MQLPVGQPHLSLDLPRSGIGIAGYQAPFSLDVVIVLLVLLVSHSIPCD